MGSHKSGLKELLSLQPWTPTPYIHRTGSHPKEADQVYFLRQSGQPIVEGCLFQQMMSHTWEEIGAMRRDGYFAKELKPAYSCSVDVQIKIP